MYKSLGSFKRNRLRVIVAVLFYLLEGLKDFRV